MQLDMWFSSWWMRTKNYLNSNNNNNNNNNNNIIMIIIIKITISSIALGLKNPIFHQFAYQVVIEQFNKPITFKVVA